MIDERSSGFINAAFSDLKQDKPNEDMDGNGHVTVPTVVD
jgi:hypothetical protein